MQCFYKFCNFATRVYSIHELQAQNSVVRCYFLKIIKYAAGLQARKRAANQFIPTYSEKINFFLIVATCKGA